MNNVFCKCLPVAVLCLCCQTLHAQPNVVFLGGGYAEMCATAAGSAESPQKQALTGSRLSTAPLEICTLAITNEGLSDTDLAGSYNNRGVLLFAQGDFAAALADFDAALDLTTTLADIHINRGYTLIALQRWAESIESFDRGIELAASQLDRAHFNRGMAHEELGRVREAYYDYLKASELNPEWDEPRRELSRFSVRKR